MRAKTYYLMRFAVFGFLAVAGPIWALGSSNGLRGWWLIGFEALFASVAAYYYWRYHTAAKEDRIHYGPPPETIRRLAAQRSRRYPLIALAGVTAIVAFELYSLRSSGQLHLVAVLIGPALLLLGIGGLVNPDVMFGARPDVEVPDSTRRVARLLMYSGLAVGLLGCWFLFFRR